MRGAWAIAASITWLGCRFSAPSGTADDDGGIVDAPAADAPSNAYVPTCMRDPSYTNGGGGHRYKWSTGTGASVDYDTAIARCAADGAHLVVVDSMEESEYLRTLIDTDTWIGLDDLTIENIFRWVTGATSTFRRFSGDEPNNNNGEDCVYMRDDGTWNDTRCEDSKRVLCECDPAYRAPERPSCMSLPGAMVRKGRKYFVRQTPHTWQEAQNDCKAMDAHLVVIGDSDENVQLDGMVGGNTYWIGYTDADPGTEGLFLWVNGADSTFHRFGTAVPLNDAEDCAVLQDGGTWDDQSCTATFPAVCECDPLPP